MTSEAAKAYSQDDDQSSAVETESVTRSAVDTTITTEGLHDLDAEVYHRDPVPDGSISSSALKIMWARSPAHARAYQLRGRKPKGHLDVGQAVHTNVLGGPEIVYWGKGEGTDTWKSGDAQKFRRQAYAAGTIPLLEDQRVDVEGMVAAIYAHDELGTWLAPDGFTAEQSGFWVDHSTGLWCRFRLDAAVLDEAQGVLTVVDLKTGFDVSPLGIAKAIMNNRYDMQKVHYEAGLARLIELGVLPDVEIEYVLAFVEKEDPYVVTLRRIGQATAAHAWRHRREALERFATCRTLGQWPGYDEPRTDEDEIPYADVPEWQLRRWANEDDDAEEF